MFDPNWILAASTTVSTAYIVRDVRNKYKEFEVTNVRVNNHNQNGVEEFYVNTHPYKSHNAISIKIKSDNSVEVNKTENITFCFSKFIDWKIETSKNPSI
jgi:hypothetical protein